MATSTLTVALAGGLGAVVGATLGQSIQWLRDKWMVGVQDRHRREDAEREDAKRAADARREAAKEAREARRADYVRVLRFLARLRQLAEKYHFAGDYWYFCDFDEVERARAHEVGLAVVSMFDSEWSDTQAHVGTSGSADVIRLCSGLERAMFQFEIYTDPDNPLGTETPEERAKRATKNAERVIKISTSIRDQINSEQEPS